MDFISFCFVINPQYETGNSFFMWCYVSFQPDGFELVSNTFNKLDIRQCVKIFNNRLEISNQL